MRRVPYDDIEFTHDRVYMHDGEPFTGVGVEIHREGWTICEVEYRHGKQHGFAREFSKAGKIIGETPYVNDLKHGREREWYDNGKVRTENVFEFDILMESISWSENGEVNRSYLRPPEDPLYKRVLQRRRVG